MIDTFGYVNMFVLRSRQANFVSTANADCRQDAARRVAAVP
jgi:hypothetical protein